VWTSEQKGKLMNTAAKYLAILILTLVCRPCWIAAQSDAAGLFKAKCAMCHAENGSGNSPSGKALKAKDLRSAETQAKSDTELSDVIAKGRNKMPGFGQKLRPDQIQQLTAYVRQLGKK
jgi:mono/diheme cytochrome c family protein